MRHYKNFFDKFDFIKRDCIGSILHFNCCIKSNILIAGPTFIPSISIISSFVKNNNFLPSTLLRLNVSQCVVQSLTRKNCATSYIFQVSGSNSPPPVVSGELFVSIIRGIYLLQFTVEFYKQTKTISKIINNNNQIGWQHLHLYNYWAFFPAEVMMVNLNC